MEWNAWSAQVFLLLLLFLFFFVCVCVFVFFYPAGLSIGLKSTSPKIAKTLSGSEFRVVKSTCDSEVCILATTCGSETCVLANTFGPEVCVVTGSRWCVVWWRHWAKVEVRYGSAFWQGETSVNLFSPFTANGQQRTQHHTDTANTHTTEQLDTSCR